METNNRTLLNGLEIDILLPDIKTAIELNGPVHYFPIYGSDKLEKIRDADTRKRCMLNSLGYGLIIIDISQQKNAKDVQAFLLSHYTITIKPILTEASR